MDLRDFKLISPSKKIKEDIKMKVTFKNMIQAYQGKCDGTRYNVKTPILLRRKLHLALGQVFQTVKDNCIQKP